MLVTGAAGFLVFNVLKNTKLESESSSLRSRLLPHASEAASQAGCSAIQRVPPYADDDREHVSAIPALSTYSSDPPTSGPHLINPLPAGVYSRPPDMGRAIHSLEHGAAIVWYSPDASGSALDELKSAMRSAPYVIAAPYQYDQKGGSLPTGKDMVMVAWHRMESCSDVSAGAAVGFIHRLAFDAGHPSAYRGRAPEAGNAL
ncbi:MAG: DUF3105 domain-containing protein [Actinomycetota bacterium]